jgi:hypothetical protein
MRDLMNLISFVSVINPQTLIKTTTNSAGIDVTALNYGNDGLVVEVSAGVITDGTHTFKLQDSLDGGTTWVDVAAPYLQTPSGQVNAFTSATTAGTVLKFGYLGNPNIGNIANSASPTGGKIQVRLVDTVTGSPATGGFYTAVAVLGHSYQMATA